MESSPRLTIPDDAPFTPAQRMWLKGFLDGVSNAFAAGGGSPAAPAAPAGEAVAILWGSQTGNCEGLAKKLAKKLSSAGHAPTVRDMAEVSAADLAGLGRVLIITSTYGDGEPPDNAAALHAELAATESRLEGVDFAVLGLGDSNYAEFCKCGHDFHDRLAALGATAILPLATADVDFDEPFEVWSRELVERLASPALAAS